MARHKEFDPDRVLDAAMRLFWLRGYEGTSTADLVRELGIARASLYGTFGSKHALYVATLDRFLGTGPGGHALQILQREGSPTAAIREFLMTSAAPEGPSGCFAVNATVEHADLDRDITRRLEANRRRVVSALLESLTRARIEGEIAPEADLPATATVLATLNAGLKVLARAGRDERDRMATTIDTTLDSLLTRPSTTA